MRMTRFTRFAIALIATIACYVIASDVTYDSDDVYAAKNAADTMGPFVFIGIFTGSYALVQLYKFIRNQ